MAKSKKKAEVVWLVCEETGDYNYTLRRKPGTEKLKLKKYSARLRKHTLHAESGNSPSEDVNPYAAPQGASLAENPTPDLRPSPWGDFLNWILWAFPAAFVLGYYAGYFEIIFYFRITIFVSIAGYAIAIAGLYCLRKSYRYSAVPFLVLGWLGILILFGFGAGIARG